MARKTVKAQVILNRELVSLKEGWAHHDKLMTDPDAFWDWNTWEIKHKRLYGRDSLDFLATL